MDEEQLKKIATALGADPSKITAEQRKAVEAAFGGGASSERSTDKIRDGLSGDTSTPGVDSVRLKAFADMEAARRSKTADRPMRVSSRQPRDPNDAKFRREVYNELGLDSSGLPGGNTTRTLADYQKDNAAVQARNEGVQTAQAEKAASLSPSVSVDQATSGDPFSAFRDSSGNIEGPAQLKERLIREGNEAFKDRAPGTPGYDTREADKAAGARFNTLFRDNSAVKNAAPEDRMSIMESLKQARGDVLRNLADQRRADPNSKPVGMVTAVENASGETLMQRGESGVRVAKSGLAGAIGGLEETPGKMELTPAGERAIRDRTVSADVSTSDGQQGRAVTGRYGTAVGGLSITDQLKANGTIPQDFQLTDKQKVGEEPLPEAYVKGRDAIMKGATSVAQERGQITDPATRMAMANTSPDKVASIDSAANAARDAAAVKAEVQRNDSALSKLYNPTQMRALDKTIASANKTGGTAFDKGGGNFGVRPSTPQDEELKRRLMGRRG